MFIQIVSFSFHSPLQLPFRIACLQGNISGNPDSVTWITQNFKWGRESNRSMSWWDSWKFSNRTEACNDILTGLSEAFNQLHHFIHIRMHKQLSLPQHYSSTDVKAQVLRDATYFYLMGSDTTMEAPETFKEDQSTSKMPFKHRGADQVLLRPHSWGYLGHPSLLKTRAGIWQCEVISLFHTDLDS